MCTNKSVGFFITQESKVLRHAGLDPASRNSNTLISSLIPAFAGMMTKRITNDDFNKLEELWTVKFIRGE
jgi:hypothetical protein